MLNSFALLLFLKLFRDNSYMPSQENPLFTWRDGRFLTQGKFVKCMWAALEKAGYPARKYTGHSFRIGMATTAGRCGIPESLIKTMGRWESTAYICYMSTAPETLRAVSRTLGVNPLEKDIKGDLLPGYSGRVLPHTPPSKDVKRDRLTS